MAKRTNYNPKPNEQLKDKSEKSSQEHHLQNQELIALMQPMVTLLSVQEERLAKKMDQQENRMLEKFVEIHYDIKETRDEFKAMNGSLRSTIAKVGAIEKGCDARGKSCAIAAEETRATKRVVEFINKVSKRPRQYVIYLLLLIIVLQTIILKAITENWLDKFWSYVRLII